MTNLEEFRAGIFGVPFSCAGELPDCCFQCWYLSYEESQVCYCEAPFLLLLLLFLARQAHPDSTPMPGGTGE